MYSYEEYSPDNNNNFFYDKISMIAGIVGIVLSATMCCCCIGYFSFPCSIIAIIMAIVSKKYNNDTFSGSAKVGLICGIIGIVVYILSLTILFVLNLLSIYLEFEQMNY